MRVGLRRGAASWRHRENANARPAHFQTFVLHLVRARGHGSLSYMAQKRIEVVFDEKVAELLVDESAGCDIGTNVIA